MALPPTYFEEETAPPPEPAPAEPMTGPLAPVAAYRAPRPVAAYARGLVRDIRVEAQNVERSLGLVRSALALADDTSRRRELKRELEDITATLRANQAAIEIRFADARGLFEAAPELYDQLGDELATMENLWQRTVSTLPGLRPASGQIDETHIRGGLERSEGLLNELIWHAALVTIPSRLEQHLRSLRVGGRLRFDEAFADELPRPEDRHRLLEYLHAHPATINGVIDVEQGIVYRSAARRRRRVGSYVGLAGLATLGGYAFVWVITRGLPPLGLPSGWLLPANRFAELLGAYALIAAGALTHVVVDAIKQERQSTAGGFVALEDWLTWIHVRELGMAAGILSWWIGLAALAVSLGGEPVTWQTAFLAGYGIDSLLDLVLGRFAIVSRTGLEGIVRRVAPGRG